jgi:hypothetical protein
MTPVSRPVDVAMRLRMWAAALLVVTVVTHVHDLAVPGLLDRSGRLKFSDYLRLYVTGVLARDERWSEFFDADAHVRTAQTEIDPRIRMTDLRPNYSPAIGIALAPLTHLPFLASASVLSACSIAAYLGALGLLLRSCRRLRGDAITVGICGLAFPTLFDTLRYGQLSAFTLLGFSVAAALWSRGRPFYAGAALGLLVYKPNLLVGPGMILALAGSWWALAGLAAGALFETAINAIAAGIDTMRLYVATLISLARNPALVQIYPEELHSWRGFVQGFVPSALVGPLTFVASIATIGVGVVVWRRSDDWRLRWSALTLAAVLTSPHLLTYDLLLLALPLLLVSDALTERQRHSSRWTWMCLLSVYFCTLVSPTVAQATRVQVSTVAAAWLMVFCATLATRRRGEEVAVPPAPILPATRS